MRIVAGEFRGRRLQSPPGRGVRPTTDRAREALFNRLHSRGLLVGARILDLFAGTGALGIEGLSRGAESAVFVESDRRAAAAVAANLESLGLGPPRAVLVRADAPAWIERPQTAGHRFDLVLADPPYGYDEWEGLISSTARVLAPEGHLVVESEGEVEPPPGWELVHQATYGAAWLGLFAAG